MTTPNLSLPELIASQSQPHVTINTSFRRLDAIVQLAAIDRVADVPGDSPEPNDGDCYLLTAGDNVDNIAQWNAGAWQYLEPQAGWLCWVIDERALYVYETTSPSGWSVLASL